MTLKGAIKKAFNDYSQKYRCTKVWGMEENGEDLGGRIFLNIEITVIKKKRLKKARK